MKMPQLIIDPITATYTIDTNSVTKYQGMIKELKQKQNINGFVLDRTGFVLNMTVLVLMMT